MPDPTAKERVLERHPEAKVWTLGRSGMRFIAIDYGMRISDYCKTEELAWESAYRRMEGET